ncbi:MAG: ASKHA domain-containing protein, partial [Eubacteriales bacterium]|nr:ASKHA domain-containing protein [Eubacteriales bacterium]
ISSELDSKIKPVGNAAGMGAARGLLSEEAIGTASEISNKIEYTELSDTEGFADMFIENMDFGI